MKIKLTSIQKNVIIEICAVLMILLFVYTAASKLLDYQKYYGEINNQPLPNWATPILTWLIPISEILAAVFLTIKKTRLLGFKMSLAMMILFTLYIATVLTGVYGRIPCSCGGVFERLTWMQHLFVNIFFIMVAFLGYMLHRSEKHLLIQKSYSKKVNPAL